MAPEGFQVFLGKNWDILLRPAVSSPANEAWVYKNPKVIGALRKGLEDAKAGRIIHIDNLEEFFKNL